MDYEYLDYLVEKKTSEEYAVDKFKKRYKFIPDKPGSKKGTITVDGEKFKVDMDTKNPIMRSTVSGEEYILPRYTGANLSDDNEIYLSREFFNRIKNQDRRDAVLNHEVGHLKLHKMNGPNPVSEKDREKTAKASSTTLDSNNHLNYMEIEADAYAAKKSGKKNLKKGLQDVYRPRTNRQRQAQMLNGAQAIANATIGNNKEVFDRIQTKRVKKENAIKTALKKDGEYKGFVGELDDHGNPKDTVVSQKLSNKQNRNDYNVRSKALDNKDLRNMKSIDDAVKGTKKSDKEEKNEKPSETTKSKSGISNDVANSKTNKRKEPREVGTEKTSTTTRHQLRKLKRQVNLSKKEHSIGRSSSRNRSFKESLELLDSLNEIIEESAIGTAAYIGGLLLGGGIIAVITSGAPSNILKAAVKKYEQDPSNKVIPFKKCGKVTYNLESLVVDEKDPDEVIGSEAGDQKSLLKQIVKKYDSKAVYGFYIKPNKDNIFGECTWIKKGREKLYIFAFADFIPKKDQEYYMAAFFAWKGESTPEAEEWAKKQLDLENLQIINRKHK